jgi:hypothetical protein
MKYVADDFAGVLLAIRNFLRQGMPVEAFNAAWDDALDSFLKWVNGLPAPVSPLTRDMELLRCFCERFDTAALRSDATVLSRVLDGLPKEGDTLALRGENYQVVGRNVTPRYGVLFLLKGADGNVIQHEHFD